MAIDFDSYRYFPSLRSRQWEMRGYSELSPVDKDRIAPMVVLANHGRLKTIAEVSSRVESYTGGRSHIIDLELSPIYACDECSQLSDPTGGFAAWRTFVDGRPNLVPTALFPPNAPSRDIVRQVILFEQSKGQVVLRSRSPSADLNTLLAILSAVESVNNLLVVLDFGYLRSRLKACVAEAASVINSLRAVDDTVRIVALGSSYPKSVAAYSDEGVALEIEERTLHSALGGDAVSIYGDYGSIHPEPFEPMQSRFVPRIDLALPDTWIFRRVRSDQGGYAQCAKLITKLTDWDPKFADSNWGASKIAAAANDDLTQMNAPAPWIAARVNMHLWQQINYAVAPASDEDDDIFG